MGKDKKVTPPSIETALGIKKKTQAAPKITKRTEVPSADIDKVRQTLRPSRPPKTYRGTDESDLHESVRGREGAREINSALDKGGHLAVKPDDFKAPGVDSDNPVHRKIAEASAGFIKAGASLRAADRGARETHRAAYVAGVQANRGRGVKGVEGVCSTPGCTSDVTLKEGQSTCPGGSCTVDVPNVSRTR